MNKQTDAEFLKRIITGDKDAFDCIFRKYYSILRNQAYNILKDISAAEDAVQEVFFNIWIKREQLGEVKYLSAYLRTTIHHYCISYLRKHPRQETVDLSIHNIFELEQLYVDILQYHQDTVTGKDLTKAIFDAIDTLPEQCKIVFTLSRNFGLKNTEVASYLNISVKAVEKHISRALTQLRNELKEYLPVFWLLVLFH
jgi:RNA polymerase sigma-70 factor (ECF subfamily)